MQACLENTALPLLESAPRWTIRVARPIVAGRNELAHELRCVPKAALRQVFGKMMGTRLWQQHRPATIAKSSAVAISPNTPTPDAEIARGMLRYLCAEAATTLRDRQRLAKSLALTVLYADGQSETVREPLPQPANDAATLEVAACSALRGARSDAFVSLKLDITAAAAQA
jgi:nucleotidyltransferase/DNA polymerase involved in DNA repair